MAIPINKQGFQRFISGSWEAFSARPSPDDGAEYPFEMGEYAGIFSATADGFWQLVINGPTLVDHVQQNVLLVHIKLPRMNRAMLNETALVNLVVAALQLDDLEI